MKSLFRLSFLSILLLIFYACNNDEDTPSFNSDQTAQLSLRLVDAPGDYEHVYVDVRDVIIKYNGDEEVSLDITPEVYDLLELTAGVSALLYDNEVPSGSISQIRLVLGDDNSIVVEGETIPLATPSAQQSGLKVQVNQTLEPGILYDYILDFDVDESIVAQGNGGYLLKPVIRASTTAESGAIAGSIFPADIQTMITATEGETSISSYANATGEFLLSGVPEGSYTVTIESDNDLDYQPIIIENVNVVQGDITDMGEIELEP